MTGSSIPILYSKLTVFLITFFVAFTAIMTTGLFIQTMYQHHQHEGWLNEIRLRLAQDELQMYQAKAGIQVLEARTERIDKNTNKSNNCITGEFLVLNEQMQGIVKIGEVQLCGDNLQFSGVYGPSIEEWKKSVGDKK